MRLLPILLLIFLIPTTYAAKPKAMDAAMNSWIGASLDDVIHAWGYPAEEKEIAHRKLYIWNTTRTLYLPERTSGTATHVGNQTTINTISYSGGLSQWNCARIFEVDAQDIVVSWQFEGNNCPFGWARHYAYRKYGNPNKKEVKN